MNIPRRCYIARYPLNPAGNDLDEVILFKDSYYSQAVEKEWDRLVAERISRIPAGQRYSVEPQLQCWYSDEQEVVCMAQTNQPFKLD